MAGSWLLALLLALALAACGSDETEGDYGGKSPDYEAALSDAPPPLAALHDQGNDLLGGGPEAFERRIAELEGFPVVVNKWASWCGPCRLEFPHFQALSAKYGERVAFLGVDSNDSEDAAATFLGEYPVPYPSYSDPDQKIAAVFDATLGFPATAFFDRSGERVFLKLGPYTSQGEFEADLQRYALGQQS